MTLQYNLLEERWMPVLHGDGTFERVGIKKAFAEAHRIREVAASNPMDRVALVRFLLALLYWCRGNPLADTDITSGKSFPAEWFSKLDENENRDCFNLLGEGKRFYQYRKEGDNADLSANYLVHEIPTGTNAWHFRHANDGKDGLCSACCALGLLRLPLFSTQGGSGKPPGINGRPPVYAFAEGVTLAQTLQLSWEETDINKLGTPAWEKPDIQLPKSGTVPLLTGLTWLPRRVWLDEPSEPVAPCIACARRETLVRHAVFAPIGSSKTDEGETRGWQDTHVIQGRRRGKKSVTFVIRGTNPIDSPSIAQSEWADIATNLTDHRGKRTLVVNFASDKNKYLEAIDYFVPGQAASEAEVWHEQSIILARKLKTGVNNKEGTPRREHSEIPAAIAAIRPHVENEVRNQLGELLAGDEKAWQAAARKYDPLLQALAKSLSPGFTVTALEKQRLVCEARPDMSLKKQENTPAKAQDKGGKI